MQHRCFNKKISFTFHSVSIHGLRCKKCLLGVNLNLHDLILTIHQLRTSITFDKTFEFFLEKIVHNDLNSKNKKIENSVSTTTPRDSSSGIVIPSEVGLPLRMYIFQLFLSWQVECLFFVTSFFYLVFKNCRLV